jgi:AraC-like DNA-binding protein
MRSIGPAIPRKMRLYRPSLCLVVQGAKEMALGAHVFPYHRMQALVVSLDVPAAGRVTEASPKQPYLAISLELDTGLIAEVLAELGPKSLPDREPSLGLFVADIDETLAGAFERLLRLLDTPAAIPVLGRQTLREIYYWLLAGPHGAAIARLTSPEGHAQRIGRALALLREDFARPIRVADLARLAGMSPSSFHQHFKALTAMTPLQYQKQLRLIEARRMIAAEAGSVAGIAYRVGYESPSQFSREYSRLFGAPPRRHAVRQAALSA